MTIKRLITRALVGGLAYFVISLILEKSYSAEVLIAEGGEAVIFALLYGAGLWVYYKYIKK